MNRVTLVATFVLFVANLGAVGYAAAWGIHSAWTFDFESLVRAAVIGVIGYLGGVLSVAAMIATTEGGRQ